MSRNWRALLVVCGRGEEEEDKEKGEGREGGTGEKIGRFGYECRPVAKRDGMRQRAASRLWFRPGRGAMRLTLHQR